MVKICHMTSAHNSDDVRIFQKECVSLAATGYDVYLVARGDSREACGVHVIGVGMPEPGRLNRILKFTKRIYEKALSLDADLYHFHDPELLPYALKLKKQGKAVIFDSHEYNVRQIAIKPYLPSLIAKIVAAVYGVYESHVMRRIDGVVFPCLIDGKNPFEGKANRIAFVDNYPKLEELYDAYLAEINPQYDVCYVGSLSEDRGVLDYIRAAKLAGVKLALAGPFHPGSLQETVSQMPEYQGVDYLGILDRNGVKSLIQRSRIGLNLLHNVGQYKNPNNLSTKVYEYMSLGKPVILNDCAFNNAMVETYRFGVCTESDPQSLSKMILALEKDAELCRFLGLNGREAVKTVFNWNHECEKLLKLYQEVIGSNQ